MRGRRSPGKRRATHNAQRLAKIGECRGSEGCKSDEFDESDESANLEILVWALTELESTLVDFEGSNLVFERRWVDAKLGCCP